MLDIEQYRTEIDQACDEFALASLDLVGSASRDDFREDSDIDLLVTFEGDSKLFDRYFGLKERLEAILKRNIDLIEERAVKNPYFMRALQRDRVKIYGS